MLKSSCVATTATGFACLIGLAAATWPPIATRCDAGHEGSIVCSHRGKTGPLCEAHAARERRSQRRRRVSRPSATSEQLDGVALRAPTPSTSMRSACSSGRSGRFSSSRLEAASAGYSHHARPSVVPPENELQTVGEAVGESSSGARNRLTKPYFGPGAPGSHPGGRRFESG